MHRAGRPAKLITVSKPLLTFLSFGIRAIVHIAVWGTIVTSKAAADHRIDPASLPRNRSWISASFVTQNSGTETDAFSDGGASLLTGSKIRTGKIKMTTNTTKAFLPA